MTPADFLHTRAVEAGLHGAPLTVALADFEHHARDVGEASAARLLRAYLSARRVREAEQRAISDARIAAALS